MARIGSSPKPARREEEAQESATILPFRLRASRSLEVSNDNAPAIDIAGTQSGHPKHGAAAISVTDRPTLAPPRYREWLQQAVIAALLLHLIVLVALNIRFTSDVERAANSGGQVSADGTAVLDVEIVAEAALPPAPTPTNMTAPEAEVQTNTPPQQELQEKPVELQKAEPAPTQAPEFALPQEETAPPQKAETAPVPQSPNQDKQEEQKQPPKQVEKKKAPEQKKKQQQAQPSKAAAPNRAAGNRTNQPNAGARGVIQNGGQANASAYSAQVLAHLQRYRIYPDQARAAGITGVSTVRFTLGSSGNVVSVSLGRGSGHGVLDQAALQMVRRAAPFPPIPPSLGRGSMSFAAPVRFNIR